MGTCLIFGINSFTGRYVSHVFQQYGYKVIGTVFSKVNRADFPGIDIHTTDLMDYVNVSCVIKKSNPDIVINLTGISFIINNDVSQFYDVHILGTRNILVSFVEHQIPVSKVILSSSAQVYGQAKYPDETTAAAPLNDYAVSKLAMEHMARIWFNKFPIIITRPFNCIGVGQSENFLVSKILSSFVAKNSTIELGNIKVARDFIDIRSAAEYYYLLATEGVGGEIYNIASGKSYSIESILDLFSQITSHQINVKFNSRFIRDNDPSRITANITKIISLPNSTQPIQFKDTLTWMIENACWG